MATLSKRRTQSLQEARNFIAALSDNSAYLFIGRPQVWEPGGSSSSSSNSDSAQPGIQETVESYYDVWRNMYGAKKIAASDAALMIDYSLWASSNTYTMYDHEVELLTAGDTTEHWIASDDSDDYVIYKCISNGAFGVSCSGKTTSVDPVSSAGTGSTIPEPGADGYRWKPMYVIEDYATNKFISATTDMIPVFEISAGGSIQSTISAAATDGAINHIQVTNEGSGYTSPPTVTITGDGTGATAVAVVTGISSSSSSAAGSSSSSGFTCPDTSSSSSSSAATSSSSSSSAAACTEVDNTVTRIIVTNPGSGYTWANIELSGGSGSGAAARAMIEPKWGHGYSAVDEFMPFKVAVVVDIDRDEGGKIPTANDFRQFGIVINPTKKNSKTVATANAYDQTYTLNITDSGSGLTSGSYVNDQIITGSESGATGFVVSWTASTASTGVLKLTTVDKDFEVADEINGDSAITVTSIVEQELEPGSGQIVMADNFSAVQRDENGLERVSLVFTF